MKKIIAREFIWLFINLLLAIPLTYLFIHFLDLTGEEDTFTANEKDFIAKLYALGYLLCFLGLVVLRIIIMVMKKFVNYARSYMADWVRPT
jgi:hypothetical protein